MFIYLELIAYTLFAFVIVLSYVAYNLYTKNVKYEMWILVRRNDTHNLREKLHALDSMQMFEKDDDVGILFEELEEVFDEYNRKVLDE
jgi:hypothetical protein